MLTCINVQYHISVLGRSSFVQVYPDNGTQYLSTLSNKKPHQITNSSQFNTSISNRIVAICFLKIEAMKQIYTECNDYPILHN